MLLPACGARLVQHMSVQRCVLPSCSIRRCLQQSRVYSDGHRCKSSAPQNLGVEADCVPADSSSTKAGLKQVALVATASGLVLGLCNYKFQRFAEEHPDSILAQDANDGIGWCLANYVVPISVTAGGVAVWLGAQCTIFGLARSWWFGSQRHWACTLLCGLTAGHYTQEIFVNKWSGDALFAHHCGAVVHALCLQCVNAWRGLLMGWGAVYEVGSVLLNLGYLGYIPRSYGHYLAGATSVLGMGLGLHSLTRHFPSTGLNAPARFCVTALLIIGAFRVQIAHANLTSSGCHA
mmetsp:Transcript_80752/g.140173  ORF Transcript_80752/g.140173 Transcript_80752/m.140173 type:complete len:292 (-) Transcript_80752:320-1195(-)